MNRPQFVHLLAYNGHCDHSLGFSVVICGAVNIFVRAA